MDVPLTEKGRARPSCSAGSYGTCRSTPALSPVSDGREETAELALAGLEVSIVVEQLFDDVDVGDLDGASLDEYRAWKRAHERADPFPNGESLDAAASATAGRSSGCSRGLSSTMLVVAHEIPVRYALNAAEGSADLDAPNRRIANATPYLFGERRLSVAAQRLTTSARANLAKG